MEVKNVAEDAGYNSYTPECPERFRFLERVWKKSYAIGRRNRADYEEIYAAKRAAGPPRPMPRSPSHGVIGIDQICQRPEW